MNKKGVYNKREKYLKRYGVCLSDNTGKEQSVENVAADSPKSAVYEALFNISLQGWEVRVCRDTPENRLRYDKKILIIATVFDMVEGRSEPVQISYLVRWR